MVDNGMIRIPCVLDCRLHGRSPLRVPPDFSGPGGDVGVVHLVTNVRPPALPQPESPMAVVSVDEK